MNTVPAQEIKRRGMAAVDDALAQGPVHVVKNNRPQYVVLTEEGYRELLEAVQESAVARIKASLEDAAAGHVTRHDSVEALLRHIESE
jgi:PHD/YefM family antitoxin component YafN of YafNO toxin-antitoxin module